MKIFKTFTIIIILFSVRNLTSQLPVRPYQPIHFQMSSPIWRDVIHETSFISEISDGYNVFSSIPNLVKPLISDDYLYETYNIFKATRGDEGFILLKRNISDGTVIWKQYLHFDSTQIQEFPFLLHKDNEGFVHVYSFRKPEDYNEFLPFFSNPIKNCSVIYRKIDERTGQIAAEDIPSLHDENYIKVTASQFRNWHYSDLVFLENQNKLLYWERNTSFPKPEKQKIYFQKTLLNGVKTGLRDSIELGNFTPVINLFKWSEDTLVYFDFKEGENCLKLHFYNTDFVKTGEQTWNNLPFPLINNSFVLPEGSHFSIFSAFHGNSFQTVKQHMLCNRSGKILDYIEVKDDYLTGDEFFTYALPLREKILISKSKYEVNPLKPITYVYTKSESGGLNGIHQWISIDTMRNAWPRNISEIDNNKILVHFIESAIYREQGKTLYSHDDYARAQSLMLFNASDIGLSTVSTNETGSESFSTSLYPNPATDEIIVRFSAKINGKGQITDGQGRILWDFEVRDEDEINVPCSRLLPGLYFIRLYNQYGHIQTTRFVRM